MPENSRADWRPTASLELLRLRARLYRQLREFFAARDVLEVETPLLSARAPTDVHIDSFALRAPARFLRTSPEYPLKRLLAAGAGDVFELGKVFRVDEVGRQHNPEFTMLEWYRLGFDHHALMSEIGELLGELAGRDLNCEALTYRSAFERHANVDPFAATAVELAAACAAGGVAIPGGTSVPQRGELLELLQATVVGPQLGHERPCFVFDYPAEQAALARLDPANPAVARRFELFVAGMELANGFHELTDAAEQRARFECDIAKRAAEGRHAPAIDEQLLAALAAGLPDCAGVALGFDRLVMWLANERDIGSTISFTWDRA